MTYVVTDSASSASTPTAWTVCPVDAFREGKNMLVIDPDECIDLAVWFPSVP